ncbi:MAG: tetratricopeptide repeat protein [Candidatus Scalindua sp.]|nr:tetratricopeptide repeat protein [Candidatus Scalindua sp.]
MLGETYLDLERYEEAIGLFKKAVYMVPNGLWSHLGLVVAYSQIGQFEKAQTEVGTVYEIDPEFSLDKIEKYESSIDPEYDKENYWDVLRKAGLN